MNNMKPWRFLYTWKQCHGAFIRPKLHWYFGSWRREGNLHFGKYKDRNDTYDYAKLVSSEWSEEGKKNHPILSKLVKPTYELPYWLSFYVFNSDIMYKTKWSEDDFRYEFPAHITFVFFGLALSVTTYIPKGDKNDWTSQDDYWESLLTYNYYNGNLKKVNDVMGCWNSVGEKNFRFRFQPRFLKDKDERNDLIEIQANALNRMRWKKRTP